MFTIEFECFSISVFNSYTLVISIYDICLFTSTHLIHSLNRQQPCLLGNEIDYFSIFDDGSLTLFYELKRIRAETS